MTRAAAIFAFALAACGARPAATAGTGERAAAPAALDLREQIHADWIHLREMARDLAAVHHRYRPGPRSTRTACELRDAVCGLTTRVCNRAVRAGDAWSLEKCSGARRACRTAEQRCCRCHIAGRSPSDRVIWCDNAR